MKPLEVLAFLRTTDACQPSIVWLSEFLEKRPEATCEEIWDALLKLAKLPDMEKIPPGTHVGKGWLSWLARHHLRVPCSNGTFSGMEKVNDGPAAEKLDRTACLAKLGEVVKGSR